MSGLSVVLLHAAMETETGQSFHPVMPMGLFSMAHLLRQRGHQVQMINSAVERAVDPAFTLESCRALADADVVAMDLHWYLHCYSVLDAARRIKAAHPRVRLVLGGYTTTCFAEQILQDHPAVDAVITGEGELPLLRYVEATHSGGPLQDVPNLAHRNPDRRPVLSPSRWTASAEELDQFHFADLTPLRHARTYLELCTGSPTVTYSNAPARLDHIFYLCLGRGCAMDCPHCGGGASFGRSCLGRDAACLREPCSVLREYEGLLEQGVRNFYLEYDPTPKAGAHNQQLLRAMAAGSARPGLSLGAWTLPGPDLLEALASAVSPRRSAVTISPDSGSATLRKRIKGGAPYSNRQLQTWCDQVLDRGIRPTVCFTMGLPFETLSDFEQTLALMERLSRGGTQVVVGSYKLEPGSPIYRDPERYGVTLYRRCLADYLEHTRLLALGLPTPHPLGYRTAAFSERQILRLQFRALRACFLRPRSILQKALEGPGSRPGLNALGSLVLGSQTLLQRAMRE